MKNGWRVMRLGEAILDIKDGGTPSRQRPEYFGGDIYWCVVKDIKPLIFDTAEKLTEVGLNNCSAKVWPVDSVIISLGATIGQVGLAKVPTATKQGLSGIVVNKALVTPEYLVYVLNEKREYIQAIATGTTIKEVRPTKLKEALAFPVPPLPEQQRIVDILDKAFDGIATAKANAKKSLHNARELFRSALEAALSGELSNDWKDERSTASVSRPHQRGSNTNGERMGWGARELGSLLIEGGKISYGIVKPGRHDPDGVRLIKSQQVRDDRMDLSADFRITKALDNEYARTRLKGGEILLNLVGASIGRSAIAPKELRGANVSRAIAVIPVRHELSSWIQYSLRGPVGQRLIQSKTGGSAQPVLNLSEVKKLTIPFPALGEQQAIVNKLDRLSEATQRLESIYQRKLAALEALKKSLLHQAFTGNL